MLNNIMPKNIAFTGVNQSYKANNKNMNSTNLQQFMLSSLPMIQADYNHKGKLNLIA